MTTSMQMSTSITNYIRRFNRFYTRQLGFLDEQLLDSAFSLTQARVIYELANRKNCTASDIKNELGLDAGQLSRMLRDFESRKLISKKRGKLDARQVTLSLTAKGREGFQMLNAASNKQIGHLLDTLGSDERNRLVSSMLEIESILDKNKSADRSYILRSPQPGDFGWVIQKNGEVYAEEYQWNEEYEGLIAEIVAKYIKNHDPKKERCWIAEKDGQNIGCVFLVRKDEITAQLRILLVDPRARGLGVGHRLVSECTRFARQAGYKKITLWTNSVLKAARHIYEKEGYKMIESEPHNSFGRDLISQIWELELSPSTAMTDGVR